MTGRTGRKRGEFEADVMSVLRHADEPQSARQISDQLRTPPKALASLFTVLGRLERKGAVLRSGTETGLRFAAVQDEAEHASRAMIDALVDTRDRTSALMRFAGELSEEDRVLLSRALRRSRRSEG